jgi:hypothetical protein
MRHDGVTRIILALLHLIVAAVWQHVMKNILRAKATKSLLPEPFGSLTLRFVFLAAACVVSGVQCMFPNSRRLPESFVLADAIYQTIDWPVPV